MTDNDSYPMLDGEPLTPDVARGMLASLRYREDTQVINHDGDHVWLKRITLEECTERFVAAGIAPERAYSYLSDCCYVTEPCERHAVMSAKGDERS
jgi:hypothetical protein